MHFREAIRHTLENEGGYVNDPDDPGGVTKYGISQRAYPKLDIANLTLGEAREIYRRDYWQRGGFFRIEIRDLAVKLFDLGVNIGVQRPALMLQQALNRLGLVVEEDAILGPVTAHAANTFAHPSALLMAVRVIAGRYYFDLENERYLAGWLARLSR